MSFSMLQLSTTFVLKSVHLFKKLKKLTFKILILLHGVYSLSLYNLVSSRYKQVPVVVL